jgi:chorismate-pyruvate lyase
MTPGPDTPMGLPTTSVLADGDPATRAAVRSATLERFTRLLAGADSATRTLAAWCGEPPTTHIHTREETATLPKEAVLLGLPPTIRVQRRHLTHRRRDGTLLCQARAMVWLDSPALPDPVLARLRTGPQPLGELLGPLGMRRRTLHANRLCDYRLCDYRPPLDYDDQDRAVLAVSAALEVAHERVALVEETYLESVLW